MNAQSTVGLIFMCLNSNLPPLLCSSLGPTSISLFALCLLVYLFAVDRRRQASPGFARSEFAAQGTHCVSARPTEASLALNSLRQSLGSCRLLVCYITLAHTFFARPSGARAALCPAVSHIMADSESDNDSTASSQVTDIFFATPSPLAQAAHNGHDMIVRACLASGTDPNGSYEGGGCALVYAMGSVHPLAQRLPGAASIEKVLACVEILLEAGALPDGPARSEVGDPETPLMKAIQQNRPAFARAFIRAGACLNVQDVLGKSLLWNATSWGNRGYACVEMLLNAGAADRDIRFDRAAKGHYDPRAT